MAPKKIIRIKEAGMRVSLIGITPDAVGHIAKCARVSHRSEGVGPEADEALVGRLIRWGHLSVLEFAQATFLVEGLSRACANQLTRHRLASFVQESQRYVDVKDRKMVVPPSLSDMSTMVKEFYAEAVELYREMVDNGVPKEDARYIIPIGAQTKLTMSANFRELRHIIQLRGSKHAQWEIRNLAGMMLDILRRQVPVVFEDLEVE